MTFPAAPDPTGAPQDNDAADDVEVADAELLRQHIRGEPEAFGALFRRHRDRLWAVALRTLCDPEEAGDALQDAMISAFRRAAQFRGDSAVTTWLHRVVVNACLDRARRRAVRQTQPLPEDGHALALANAEQPDVAQLQERRLDILTALRSLGADQRAAVVLVDMEGYSVTQAAELMQCAPGTVKSRCARGRARLAALLSHLRFELDRDLPATGNQPGVDDVTRPSPQAKPAEQGSSSPPEEAGCEYPAYGYPTKPGRLTDYRTEGEAR